MNAIRIDTGVQEYQITDEHNNVLTSVTLNPTDMNFADTILTTLEKIGTMYTEYQAEAEKISKMEDEQEAGVRMFELGRSADGRIRDELNGLFEKDICTPILGKMSSLTRADGFPIWANIIFGFIDLLDEKIVEEKKKENPRIEKYTKKYSRKR